MPVASWHRSPYGSALRQVKGSSSCPRSMIPGSLTLTCSNSSLALVALSKHVTWASSTWAAWWDRVSENLIEPPCAEVSGITWADMSCFIVRLCLGIIGRNRWYAISFHNFPYASHVCNLNRSLRRMSLLGAVAQKGFDRQRTMDFVACVYN